MDHNAPLTMIRPTLDSLPEHALPAGFSLRRFMPGDMDHWLMIHRLADRYNEVAPSVFRGQFGDDDRLLAERQLYLLDAEGTAIGTATAWFNEQFRGGRWGRIHWVAIMPALQGRGLAKPLLSAACRRLRELGHERAYLTTASARLPAINLYLAFGFRPLPIDAAEQAHWSRVLARLGRPKLP